MAQEHDKRYKKFFSHPQIMQRLLTGFVEESFISELAFDTLRLVDKQFITEEHEKKESDLLWEAHYRGKPLYIYILLEFQSTVDQRMALRFLHYVTSLYQYLETRTETSKLPAVFPLLLYNGDEKWSATTQVSDLIESTISKRFIGSVRKLVD